MSRVNAGGETKVLYKVRTLTHHRSKFLGSSRSIAICGSPTVSRPELSELSRVREVSDVAMMTILQAESLGTLDSGMATGEPLDPHNLLNMALRGASRVSIVV